MRDEPTIETIRLAVARARPWLRLEGARDGAVRGFVAGAASSAVLLVAAELSTSGAGPAHLFPVVMVLVAGAAVGGLRPQPGGQVATTVDRRLDLQDHLGTAWAFAADDRTLARRQRLAATGLAAGLSFGPSLIRPVPPPWRGRSILAAGALLLTFAATWLHSPAPPERVQAPVAAEDQSLLELVEEVRTQLVAEGRLEAASILLDLDRTVREIRDRERVLSRRVAQAPPPPPPPEEARVAPPPEPPPPPPDLVVPDGLSAAALETRTAEQLVAAAISEREAIAQLFERSKEMDALTEEFAEMMEREAEASAAALPSFEDRPGSALDSRTGQVPGLGSSELSARLDTDPNEQKARVDMVRRSLDAETQGEHDYEHAMQEQFREFLKDVVKDVADAVKKAALGQGKKKGQGVSMQGGEAVADKQDAMEKSGFRDSNEAPKKAGGERPEQVSGGDGSAGDTARGGAPPPGAKLEPGAAPPGGEPGAGPSGGPGSGTTAGAQGAGTGAAEGGGQTYDVPASEGGTLERALGRVGQGHLPPERKEQLFQRLARHKVESSERVMEADEVLFDYFSGAETELQAFSDELPPLFRAMARSYFDSIRPGADGDVPATPPPASEVRPAAEGTGGTLP